MNIISKLKNNLFYFMVFFAAILYSVAGRAEAVNPKDFVTNVSNKVIEVVSSDMSDAQKEKNLDDIFNKTVDVKWIAQFVASKYWRESAKEQQDKYLELYSKFLMNSYVPKFRQYTGQKLAIGKVTPEIQGEYLIETSINDKDGKSVSVNYKLRQAEDGNYKVYDIIAEGVSMITTQRSEFGSILAREGMDSLIKKLEQRVGA